MTSIDISAIQKQQATKKAAVGESGLTEFLSRELKITTSGLSAKHKMGFYSDLHMLMDAGIDLKAALDMLIEEQQNKRLLELYRQISEDIVAGNSLFAALKKTGKFSAYEYQSIRIGEESGKLTTMVAELAKHFTEQIKQRRQLINSLSYPLVITITAIVAVAFMLAFIIPIFEDLFARFDTELPAITRALISISSIFSEVFVSVILIVLLVAAGCYLSRKQNWYRAITSRLILKIPIIGNIIRKSHLARFSHTMHLLLNAKTPLTEAIELTKSMVNYYPVEKALETLESEIIKGIPLHKSLAKFPVFEKRYVSLVKAGEEVNQLPGIFERLSRQYSEQLEHQTGLLNSLLQPLLIVFLGIVIGIVVIAMYLPMFKLGTTIGI